MTESLYYLNVAAFEKHSSRWHQQIKRGERLEENGSHGGDVFWGVPQILVLRKQSINKIKSLSKIYSEVNSLNHDRNLSFAE